VVEYNTDRPHQGLNTTMPVTPAERFQPVPVEQRALLDLWLPPTLEAIAGAPCPDPIEAAAHPEPDDGQPPSGPADRSSSIGWCRRRGI
jgi:hypothetical protein